MITLFQIDKMNIELPSAYTKPVQRETTKRNVAMKSTNRIFICFYFNHLTFSIRATG